MHAGRRLDRRWHTKTTMSREMSQCRVVLRMLDDWPMLKYSMQYGLGKSEEDQLLRFVSIVKNIADQVFFLVEHMAWLSDKRVIRFRDTNRLWTTSKFLWAFSLYCGCIKAIRSLKKLGQQQDALRNETTEIRRAKAQHVVALLISSLNLINAISWLPKGVLWAGKLKTWHNGAIGLAASFLSLVQLLTSMN
ncbi:peroxisomal membrane protein 11C-like isoform X2 [Varroa jacobsoni]|uniref:Peroxisomal membrane protein 11C n=1 Tax=Varroa destructor TaxID=109461 RepID=A0A7M7KED0_VARDE|nr:peroxisomal membrane protein 11C-like isoform X2 [Varroa destructor]XP_022709674.1 peroxisomal membrane protein 11C-like isoform X2 [Varroa jacobsoni]